MFLKIQEKFLLFTLAHRKDTFDPLPTFDEPSLPRELKFYNYKTDNESSLFPLVLTASSGLGVDFARY